jgi:hypothetical protein
MSKSAVRIALTDKQRAELEGLLRRRRTTQDWARGAETCPVAPTA